ncbi:hypothetical protein HBI56_080880 [Parastagonospora nodorum]|uniref:Uncharacterized protein n=1 Tax=Phaeosphaeria nodorum (strain SN15 / ATCC MYA-4574 / FGSC 10173) TaxID=321614 RepID=A0A7U2FGE3_PHANO|nr:hypothetical protein HBH56_105820 [Parastagonospora nodorum]QRD04785.1 hypothetical protein JI435_421690 [Parastagonospora nodorum SN15]KAH3929238.1 hypothetical protein HBH54_124590 [Parastagonospora nodorum]KAH3951376.1 hypothetical protein HBH53_058590 [Parastagonospora nodorum]KAH3975467.1 hypothetical protein HBH52_128280 [Parastagonospora nodorum]
MTFIHRRTSLVPRVERLHHCTGRNRLSSPDKRADTDIHTHALIAIMKPIPSPSPKQPTISHSPLPKQPCRVRPTDRFKSARLTPNRRLKSRTSPRSNHSFQLLQGRLSPGP